MRTIKATIKTAYKKTRKLAKSAIKAGRAAYNAAPEDMKYRFKKQGKYEADGFAYIMSAYDKQGRRVEITFKQWTGFYIGKTDDMVCRMAEHISGHGCESTKWAFDHAFRFKLELAIETDDSNRLESLLKKCSSSVVNALLTDKVSIEQIVDYAERLPNPSKANVESR